VTRIVGGQEGMRFFYDRAKADELAGHLLQLGGKSMGMLKLLKLMYLADRTSLIETGFLITGDAIVAMDMGPVLSNTYNRLKPTGDMGFISHEPGNVILKAQPPTDGLLSDYEIGVARQIFKNFGHMTGRQLTDYLHRHAPEWEAPPTGSSRPIDPAAILRAAGKSENEIAAIAAQADYFYTVDQRLA
jgi:uncharacterized phage-associated protein